MNKIMKEKKMRKGSGVYLCAFVILPAAVFTLCAAGAFSRGNGANFKDVQGKEWTLLEIKSRGNTVSIDRKKLEAVNLGGVFTVNFEGSSESEGRLRGVGAPNRYFGPYTLGGNKTISVGLLAGTMMAAIFEPEELKENEFLDYLSKTSRWDLKSGKLELYSANSSGAETVLIFEAK
jgi:heat shock protein HslJ